MNSSGKGGRPTDVAELLAPDTFRDNWRSEKKDTPAVREEAAKEVDSLESTLFELRSLVNKRYTGDEATVLNLLIDELDILASDEMSLVRDDAVGVILNRMEDLMEAYGI